MYFINFRVFLFAAFYNKVLKIYIYDIEHKSIKRELSKKKEDMKLRGRYRYGKSGGKELGVNNAWKYPSVNKNTKQGRKVFQNKEIETSCILFLLPKGIIQWQKCKRYSMHLLNT